MKEIILTHTGAILLQEGNGEYRLPEGPTPLFDKTLRSGESFSFGDYKAYRLKEDVELPWPLTPYGLRESWNVLPGDEFKAAAKGAELLNWDGAERFCARCGEKLRRNTEISKICPGCGNEYFPRLNPAIVVLVIKEKEALLVHASTLRNPEVKTLVAGYVETGESLEECVCREIKEETDLEVSDVRYFGSQAWPFPYQLMVGFTARYRSGTLRFADGEITSGGFFTKENMPTLPTMPSLSRMIIEEWRKGNFDKC